MRRLEVLHRFFLTFLGHPIADAHPGNLDAIVFPGQDYNNARVYDFAEVNNWNQNKRMLTLLGSPAEILMLFSRSNQELKDGLV